MSAFALKLIFSRILLRYVLTVLTLRLSSLAMTNEEILDQPNSWRGGHLWR